MVKTVVKQALTRKMGNTAREKVLEPQGKIVSRANRSSTLSKTPKPRALPSELHPDIHFPVSAVVVKDVVKRRFSEILRKG